MNAMWIIVVAVVIVAALLLVPLPWPESLVGAHLTNRIDIDAPPARVFAYVATPSNWPKWHPASRAVRGVVERTPAIGESLIETFEVAGRRDDATWTTVELVPPSRWRFVAAGERGGGAEITYTLTPRGSGTMFERDLHYRGPNLMFGIVNALKLRSVMERDSATALANVKQQIESAAPQ
jgi:uncharacterized protein YndB with AHSA1/START domain